MSIQASESPPSPESLKLLNLRDLAIKLMSPPSKVFIEEVIEPQPRLKKQSIFFNDGFAVSAYKKVADLHEEGFEVKKKKAVSKAPASLTPNQTLTLRSLAPPPPGFLSAPKLIESRNHEFSTDSSWGSGVHPSTIQSFDISLLTDAIATSTPILEELPQKSQHKRVERCQYEGEQVIGDQRPAVLKFYNLKKRFGFLTLTDDGTDIFFCEDDIMVSGQPLKVFKDAVVRKKSIQAVCDVIRYGIEEEKLKAANIEFSITE